MLETVRLRWHDARHASRDLRRFNALPRSARSVVFYAETAADWAHLEPIVAALEARGQRVARVTSDRNDPALRRPDTFFVGFGSARTVLFRTIEADAFVMTLPDLNTFHLKRSVRPTHYYYVFHSIASTHRVYRPHAFDAYDTIFCVGPHHFREIERAEELDRLRPKRLIAHGYGRLDTLLRDLDRKEAEPAAAGRLRVLVAPSWGESSIVRHCLDRLLDSLLRAPVDVTLRLHPMTVRHQPELPERLVRRYAGTERFRFDAHVAGTHALLDADVMVSEWSGAALEYAFARERPVVFIDTPPKVHNPEYTRFGLRCLEESIREEIGCVVGVERVDELPDVLRGLTAGAEARSARIRAARDKAVFNVGTSGEVAAAAILDTLRAG